MGELVAMMLKDEEWINAPEGQLLTQSHSRSELPETAIPGGDMTAPPNVDRG